MWLTSVTVWLFCREGVAKSPCRCGSVFEIYSFVRSFSEWYLNHNVSTLFLRILGYTLVWDDYMPPPVESQWF